MKTKHIIATGTGNIGIAARIAELLTIRVGSILLSFESMLMRLSLMMKDLLYTFKRSKTHYQEKNRLVLELA